MIKIGITTHYTGSTNYGGCLQAFALQKELHYMGYSAMQIRFWSTDIRIDQRIRRTIKSKRIMILYNAIDTKKYRYNALIRADIRKELGLDDSSFTIGHVGRLTYQKNQFFLLDIFKELTKINYNAILLMVGDGPDEEALKEYAEKLRISESVWFLGNRTDVSSLMQAMDLFLLPSRSEGFGIVTIESQSACLPTICSTNVPLDVKATDLVKFISLKREPKQWAELIQTFHNNTYRYDISDIVAKRGYDISVALQKLLQFYSLITK